MSEDVLLVEIRDGVRLLTLNRPRARNAVNARLATEIVAAVDAFEADDATPVAVLTGAGGTFCAGMDLKAFAAGELPFVAGRGFAGLVERPPRKPIIAAVEGYALAGGFEIALACDVIVAAEDATFGLPEVTRSLVAAGGGLLRLPRRVPHGAAMIIALTGDPVGARRAHELGVVDRLTAPGQALPEALGLANRIAANGPLAVRATKRILAEQAEWPAGQFWTRQDELAGSVFASDDAKEGAQAFAEKRPPRWRGR